MILDRPPSKASEVVGATDDFARQLHCHRVRVETATVLKDSTPPLDVVIAWCDGNAGASQSGEPFHSPLMFARANSFCTLDGFDELLDHLAAAALAHRAEASADEGHYEAARKRYCGSDSPGISRGHTSEAKTVSIACESSSSVGHGPYSRLPRVALVENNDSGYQAFDSNS